MRKRQKLFSLAGVVCLVLAVGLVWTLVGASSAVIMRVFLRYAALTCFVGSVIGIACAIVFLDNVISIAQIFGIILIACGIASAIGFSHIAKKIQRISIANPK